MEYMKHERFCPVRFSQFVSVYFPQFVSVCSSSPRHEEAVTPVHGLTAWAVRSAGLAIRASL